MNTIGMIEVTNCDIRKMIATSYDLSGQQGLGLFDPTGASGSLSEGDIDEILSRSGLCMAFVMDYINGRSVKLSCWDNDGKLYINNHWYDHSDETFKTLLNEVGLSPDLIQQSRDEEAAYKLDCIEKAKNLITKNGGKLSSLETDKETERLMLSALGGIDITYIQEPKHHHIWTIKE